LKQTKSIEDRCADYMADFERKVNERMGKLELEVHDVKSTLDTMSLSQVSHFHESDFDGGVDFSVLLHLVIPTTL
jgi:hypothetical protein